MSIKLIQDRLNTYTCQNVLEEEQAPMALPCVTLLS